MFMLDTDTCSYIMREKAPVVLGHLRRHASATIAISAIVHAELLFGARSHPSRCAQIERLIAALVSRLRVLEWAAANAYAQIRTDLKAAGTPIGGMDLLIAAHALTENAVLVTNNTRHFGRVPGLRLQNWSQP